MKSTTKNYHLNKLQSIIPAMLIVMLVFSGRFKIPYFNNILPNMVYVGTLIVILLLILIFIYGEGQINRNATTFILLNLLLFTYMGARSFNNSNIQEDLIFIEMLMYVTTMIIFIFIFLKNKYAIQNIILSIFVLTFLFGLIGLLSGNLGEERLSVLGGGSNVFGRYMVFGYIISIYYIVELQKRHLKLFMIVTMFVFLMLSIQTGSRQALLGVFIATMFYGLYLLLRTIRTKKIHFRSILLISAITISLLYIFLRYATNTIMWSRFVMLFEGDKGSSVNTRLMMIDRAQEMFYNAPLFGEGMGAFGNGMLPGYTYPHNLIYELLSEYGLIGLMLFLTIVSYIGYKSLTLIPTLIKNKLNFNLHVMFLLKMLFMISFYFSLVSGNLYDSRWIWFYGTLIFNYTIIMRSDLNNEKGEHA